MPPAHPVTLNQTLNQVATLHSQDIAGLGVAQHAGSDGSGVKARVRRSGYVRANQRIVSVRENILVLEMSWNLNKALQLFRDEPAHCMNLMYDDVTEAGVGIAVGKYVSDQYQQGGRTWYTTSDGRYVTVVLAQPGP